MPVNSCAKLFSAVLHLTILLVIHGSLGDDLAPGNGRSWSPGGAHYRMVVSSLHHDDTELKSEESVGYPYIHKDRPSKGSSEEVFDSDKVTQRVVKKNVRKRTRLSSSSDLSAGMAVRNRRRHPVASSLTGQVTTGPPRTMSYNLYNHFRPIEQDVPQEVLLPFLDFGKKLSTPSGFNSIEGSSTPSDSTVTSSTARSRNVSDEDESVDVYHEDMDVAVTVKAVERNIPPRRPVQMRQSTFFTRSPSKDLKNDSSVNKTDVNSTMIDLQSNESGVKVHAVLSPNYGLKLNYTPPESSNVTSSPPRYSSEVPAVNKTEATVDTASEKPNPTARILSTAVVTSVSVKESPRVPRVKPNASSENENEGRKNESATVKPLDQRNEALLLNIARRKLFGTPKPKTTTFRPVLLRSSYRKNSSLGVLHIVSTPPTYIEVPKISPALVRTTNPPDLNSALETRVSKTVVDSVLKQEEIVNNNTEIKETLQELTLSSTTVISESKPSTISTTVAPSSTVSKTTPTTTKTAETTESLTTFEPTTITEALEEIETTEITNDQTTDSPPLTTLEIEFKPLVENITVDTTTVSTSPTQFTLSSSTTKSSTSTTTTTTTTTTESSSDSSTVSLSPTTNFSIPYVPDLFWVYGQRNNGSPVKSQPSSSTVGVTFQGSTIGVVTYILAALGVIPLVLGAVLAARQILLKGKTKVLDESEYSSEYNRSPLPTKLPRLPAHLNWEETKPEPPPIILTTKWEFPREKLRLQTVLGQGNFGQVWKAEADDISGHEGLTRLVAVKTVKEGASIREKEDLLRELGIMQELGAHPNVVTLLGCCTEKEPYFLIMEYVMYGKMLAFLREHRTRAHYFNFSDLSSALTSRDLTVFAYCVARGMEYISSKGIVHRDLAARNVLVDHNKLCKIADFGMSRNVRDTGEIYEQRPNNRGALPIRWMAPESLHYNIFTQKTDVWSFGILLWEIITLGSTPYSTMGAREVMRQVGDGFRLERPKHCRPEFFRVAVKCWSTDPGKRPTFSELKQEIGALLGTNETEGGYVDLEALAEEMCDQHIGH